MKFTDFVHCKQKPSCCGPASLVIALSYFHIHVSQDEMIKAARTTVEEGTFHSGIIRALAKYRCGYLEGCANSVEYLKMGIRGGFPIIVGWYKEDPPPDDHYSVVYRINRKWIWLIDPEEPFPVKMDIKKFEKNFYDYDKNGEKTYGWFVAIHSCGGRK